MAEVLTTPREVSPRDDRDASHEAPSNATKPRSRGRRPRGPNAARRRVIRCQLAARDGARCFYCGTAFAALGEATIDHLVPHCQLPGWKLANLVLACGPCNRAKGDRLPQEFLRPPGFGPGLTPVRAGRVRALMRTVRVLWAVLVRTACGTAGVRAVSGRCKRSDRGRVSAHAQIPISDGERSATGLRASIRPRGASSSTGGHRRGLIRTDAARTGAVRAGRAARMGGAVDRRVRPVGRCRW
jgi:5-methylcytosine-specific restriction endonuclease McrA